MGTAVADRIDAAIPLDDAGVVAYMRLVQRGLRIAPTGEDGLTVGPREHVTDEVRALVAAHKPALRAVARHRAAWTSQPWSDDVVRDMLVVLTRDSANPGTELQQRVSAAEIRAGAANLPTKERRLALALAESEAQYERVLAAESTGEFQESNRIFHGDYWQMSRAFHQLLESEWNLRMPQSVAVLSGTHPALAACEGLIEDAIANKSLDGCYLACLALRYASAVARQKRIEKEAQEEVW